MGGIKALSGLAWSHDILTGKRPIPTFNKNEPEKGERFQNILDEETKKIKEEPCKEENECMFSDYTDMPYRFDDMTGSMNL